MFIANAPCSWGIYNARNPRFTPDQYLDQVAEAGFPGTELGPYGYMPTDVSALHDALAARNLTLVGAAHVHSLGDAASAPQLMATVREIAPILTRMNAPELVLMDGGDWYPAKGRGELDAEGWRALTGMVSEARKMLADDFGVRLTFHPHVATAVETEDQIDRLLADTDVELCFDVGHHAGWDQDPVAYMKKVWDRIGYMHLKNVDGAVRARVLSGELPMRDASDEGLFCPLPDGVVDIGAVLALLREKDFTGPIVVEQDPSEHAVETPAALARRNADYLKSVLGQETLA